jgi:uncharacterized protein (TIGR02118 family)
MVKVIWLLRFREDMDPEDVRKWWRTDHGALALKVPGLRRYVQNHLMDPLEEARAEAGMPFQGMVEVWFDDLDSYNAAMASPEWKALEADGVNGLEMTALAGGFATEYIMRWDGLPDRRIYTSAGQVPEA